MMLNFRTCRIRTFYGLPNAGLKECHIVCIVLVSKSLVPARAPEFLAQFSGLLSKLFPLRHQLRRAKIFRLDFQTDVPLISLSHTADGSDLLRISESGFLHTDVVNPLALQLPADYTCQQALTARDL